MELDSHSNEADNEVENNKLIAIVEEIRTTKKYNKMHDYQDEVTMLREEEREANEQGGALRKQPTPTYKRQMKEPGRSPGAQ